MPSPAILLTGATGLLGRFILRRLLQAGHDVAVVVRPGIASNLGDNPDDTAARRVEQILQPMEADSLLPRPKVIAWDFAEDDSSCLSQGDRRWLSGRPIEVIHCAASIRFVYDATSGEPFHTNVNGTRNLLSLCEQLELTAFHHVSTAYVGDHRNQSVVPEVPVTSVSRGGNDYETSKIQAEQLVYATLAGLPLIIHRPSIVVGDSQSFFTSTYHGFYAPLQIGWQFAKLFGFSDEAGQWFRQQLGLKPGDHKNLVTVDWVAEGIVRTLEQRQQGFLPVQASCPLVLHWTNPNPVACQVMQSAIVDSIDRSTQRRQASISIAGNKASTAITPPSPEQFREQMRVYESYFQSDPVFDNQQSSKAAGELNCPTIDHDLLSRLSDWAIGSNFGWPKPALPSFGAPRIDRVLRQFHWLESRDGCTMVRVQLLGPGSPETLCFGIAPNRCGRYADYTAVDQVWRISLPALTGCITGTTDLNETIRRGYWVIEGNKSGEALECARIWINHIGTFL